MPKNISKNKRVVVAMSGGVDSSVAAYLLKKQGYDVIGIFLKLWEPSCYMGGKKKSNLCCDDKAMGAARQIADKLEIPFYVLKVDKLFKKEIVDNFISEYDKGVTPNPCVRCNKYIKFGYLWEKTRQLKADYLATGHYIGTISNDGVASRHIDKTKKLQATSYKLVRSKDVIKDQTYFLSSIDPKIIPHLLFPLGNMTKFQVRAIAKKAKLPVYNKKDSMGVCFIPDGDTDSFLKKFSKKLQKTGEIVDKRGNILGKHKGLIGYTVGKRVGDSSVATKYMKKMSKSKLQMSNKIQSSNDQEFEINKFDINLTLKSDIPRLYVVSIDSKKNCLVVGENEDCFADTMIIKDMNVLNDEFWEKVKNKKTFYAQIRGGHRPEKCKITFFESRSKSNKLKSYNLQASFLKPVRAITPGQTVALYDKDVLMGGGIIS